MLPVGSCGIGEDLACWTSSYGLDGTDQGRMSMPAALRLQVSKEEHARLARQYDETDRAEARTRYQMVLLAVEGYSAPQIAPLVRRSVDTVQRVLRRYQAEGAAGIP